MTAPLSKRGRPRFVGPLQPRKRRCNICLELCERSMCAKCVAIRRTIVESIKSGSSAPLPDAESEWRCTILAARAAFGLELFPERRVDR